MKRFFIAVSLAVLGVGAVAFYYWQQATQLPAWYTANQIEPTRQPGQPASVDPTIAADLDRPNDRTASGKPASAPTSSPSSKPKATADATPPTAQKQPVKKQLHQNELTQLFTTEIARKAESRKLGGALKGANTTMQNGTVESGAVVNLGDISPDQLPPDERAFFSKLVTAFPELSRQSFYIGVEGKPTVKNGQAQLGEDLRVKLGNLSFTPAQLSERLGIPEEQIRQQLQLQVQLGNLKAKGSQLADDRPSDGNGSN
ncbi:MAG: hypothetical protein KME42_17280 [Tildeniella nuda ZEHNDER 1965/U140]|jgi:hypothetical protein|nr:hypothetical protein [Tildeniella nuda ZEHNDER 1965/U140]